MKGGQEPPSDRDMPSYGRMIPAPGLSSAQNSVAHAALVVYMEYQVYDILVGRLNRKQEKIDKSRSWGVQVSVRLLRFFRQTVVLGVNFEAERDSRRQNIIL